MSPPSGPTPEPSLLALWRFLRANPLLLAFVIAVFAGALMLGVLAAREAGEMGLWDVPVEEAK